MKTIQILILFLALIMAACNSSPLEEFVVGKNFITDQAGITKVDTFTMRSSVYKLDSVISTPPSRFLIGCNYNTFSGYKNSNPVFAFKFDSDISNTKFVYDSLCLVLNHDNYWYGDTTVTQTFKVHQLTQKLANRSDGYLYTTSNFSYDATPLGSVTLKPRPNTKKSISIKLSDKFGSNLARLIKAKRDTLTSSSLFVENILKGIIIKSERNVKGASIGIRKTTETSDTQSNLIKTMPEMRLYYHLSPNPEEKKDLYYKFSFDESIPYFNQIESDNTGSLLEGIENTKNEKDSKMTNNQIFMQSGAQVFSKFRFPYLYNLVKSHNNTALVGAILKLYPVKGTYKKTNELPDTIYVFKGNRKNDFVGRVTLPGSSTKYAYGTLITPTNAEESVYYQIDVSAFIESEMKEPVETSNSLFLGYGSYKAKKANEHVIFGGANSGKYSPSLGIFFYHN